MKVEIYSTQVCGYCKKAKLLLDELGIGYVEYDVYQDSDAMAVMRDGKHTTVPQIFIDDVHIGGYTELREMHNAGVLDVSSSAD